MARRGALDNRISGRRSYRHGRDIDRIQLAVSGAARLMASDDHGHKLAPTTRVETFSDGVMAIAITLLVLNLHVHTAAEITVAGGLLPALAGEWPAFVAYIASFVTIGIIWLNHHALIETIATFDWTLHWLNLLLLLGVATLPFSTALMAEYVGQGGPSASIAAAIYGALALVMALPWSLIWLHLARNPRLFEEGFDADHARQALRRNILGPIIYLVATIVALFAPLAALALYAVIAAFFAGVRQAD